MSTPQLAASLPAGETGSCQQCSSQRADNGRLEVVTWAATRSCKSTQCPGFGAAATLLVFSTGPASARLSAQAERLAPCCSVGTSPKTQRAAEAGAGQEEVLSRIMVGSKIFRLCSLCLCLHCYKPSATGPGQLTGAWAAGYKIAGNGEDGDRERDVMLVVKYFLQALSVFFLCVWLELGTSNYKDQRGKANSGLWPTAQCFCFGCLSDA